MKIQIDQLMSVIDDLTHEMAKKINENEFDFSELAEKRLILLKELFTRSSEISKTQLYNYIVALQIRDEKIVQALNQEYNQCKKSLKNINILQRYTE